MMCEEENHVACEDGLGLGKQSREERTVHAGVQAWRCMVLRRMIQALQLDGYQGLRYQLIAVLSCLCPCVKSIFTGRSLQQHCCQFAFTILPQLGWYGLILSHFTESFWELTFIFNCQFPLSSYPSEHCSSCKSKQKPTRYYPASHTQGKSQCISHPRDSWRWFSYD